MNRREAILSMAGAIGTAVAASDLRVISPAFAEEGKSMETINAKPLPFDEKKLKGISEKLIVSHWENNYGGSVKALNATNKKLAEVKDDKDFPPFLYNELKREHLMRTGSVVFHELYFGNLGGNEKLGGSLEKEIKKHFSDVNAWETEFRKMGNGLGGGSGWVILGYNFHLKRLENYWAADHMHSAAGAIPLLVMDMYEHSYQMDYGAAAAKYVDAFFQNIDWVAVEKRFEKAHKFSWT